MNRRRDKDNPAQKPAAAGESASMGKSFELLGLMAFNVFLGLILAVTFLPDRAGRGALNFLTEDHVASFINEVNNITTGADPEIDSYDITKYFQKHVADGGQFVNTVRYQLPDQPMGSTQEKTLQMGKIDFISHVLKGMQSMQERQASLKIESIEIAENGRSATVVTTSEEKGLVPVQVTDEETTMTPVVGISFCEQTVVLDQNYIQMIKANCTTSLSFTEFR